MATNLAQSADEHTGENLVSAKISFEAAATESDITSYKLYAGHPISPKAGGLVATIPAAGYTTPRCTGASCEKITIASLDSYNNGQAGFKIERRPGGSTTYDADESARIVVKGPGTIRFTFMNTELGFDWVKVGDITVTGELTTDTLPDPIEIPRGSTVIEWYSDFLLQGLGWTAEFSQDRSYSYEVTNVDLSKADYQVATHWYLFSAYGSNEGDQMVQVQIDDNKSGGDAGGAPPDSVAYKVEFYDQNGAGNMLSGKIAMTASGPGITRFSVELEETEPQRLGGAVKSRVLFSEVAGRLPAAGMAPQTAWIMGDAMVAGAWRAETCTEACARSGSECIEGELAALAGKSDAEMIKLFEGAKDHSGASPKCGGNSNSLARHCDGQAQCHAWGAPYIHKTHWNQNCWSSKPNTISGASCGARPVDAHHRRLCPCAATDVGQTPNNPSVPDDNNRSPAPPVNTYIGLAELNDVPITQPGSGRNKVRLVVREGNEHGFSTKKRYVEIFDVIVAEPAFIHSK